MSQKGCRKAVIFSRGCREAVVVGAHNYGTPEHNISHEPANHAASLWHQSHSALINFCALLLLQVFGRYCLRLKTRSVCERASERKSLEGRKRMMQRRRIPAFRRRRRPVVLLLAVLFLQECTAARAEVRSGASLPETTRRRRRRRRLKLGVEPVVETKPQNEEPQQPIVPADEPQQLEQQEVTAVDNADETCTISGPCEQCTDSERFMVPEACMATGKRQPYTCVKGR